MPLRVSQSAGSCVVFEVSNLESEPDAKTALQHLIENLPTKPQFVIFSGVTKNAGLYHITNKSDYGTALATILTESGLGRVTETGERKSWTGNMVKCWIWEPDREAIQKWKVSIGNPLSGATGAANNPVQAPPAGAWENLAVPVGDARRAHIDAALAGIPAGVARPEGEEAAALADFLIRRRRGDYRTLARVPGILTWHADGVVAPSTTVVDEWRRKGWAGRW